MPFLCKWDGQVQDSCMGRSSWASSDIELCCPCCDVMVQWSSCEIVRNWIYVIHTFNLYIFTSWKSDMFCNNCIPFTGWEIEAFIATQCIQSKGTKLKGDLAPGISSGLGLYNILPLEKHREMVCSEVSYFLTFLQITSGICLWHFTHSIHYPSLNYVHFTVCDKYWSFPPFLKGFLLLKFSFPLLYPGSGTFEVTENVCEISL